MVKVVNHSRNIIHVMRIRNLVNGSYVVFDKYGIYVFKGPLGEHFQSRTTGQEHSEHGHYNGQFLASECSSFDRQCALYTGKEFPSQSSLLTIVINFSEDIIFMEKIFLDAQHSHYTSLENVTLTYLFAFDQFADFAFL